MVFLEYPGFYFYDDFFVDDFILWYSHENGSLDIGWKYVAFAEVSQGSGTWTMTDNAINVTIHYNYGETVYSTFVIRSNQLYDAYSDRASVYLRD